jgi:hypothetical protein
VIVYSLEKMVWRYRTFIWLLPRFRILLTSHSIFKFLSTIIHVNDLIRQLMQSDTESKDGNPDTGSTVWHAIKSAIPEIPNMKH